MVGDFSHAIFPSTAMAVNSTRRGLIGDSMHFLMTRVEMMGSFADEPTTAYTTPRARPLTEGPLVLSSEKASAHNAQV
jgi:hypothetical protein